MRKGKGFTAFFLAVLFVQGAAQASSLYESAVEEYKTGRFKKAAADLAAACTREPSRQLYHYLRANCLVHLSEHQRAAEEYKVAYLLDPLSETGEFCRQALIAYKKPLPVSSSPSVSTSKVSSYSGSKLQLESGEIKKVKTLISKQTDFEKDKHCSAARNSEQTIKSQVNDELRRIDQQMQSDIQKLYDPLVYMPEPRANPLLIHPDLLKEKEDQIKLAAQLEKERILKESGERTRSYENWRKDRSSLLDETADNLQSLLEQPAGPSGVKLQARGTGLYVRNYARTGQNRLPDSHAATARIVDAASAEGSATEASPAASPAAGSTEVKGNLLNSEMGNSYASRESVL